MVLPAGAKYTPEKMNEIIGKRFANQKICKLHQAVEPCRHCHPKRESLDSKTK